VTVRDALRVVAMAVLAVGARSEHEDRLEWIELTSTGSGVWSSSAAMVVVQQFAEPIAAFKLATRLADFGAGLDEAVVEPLMVSLRMVVLDELMGGVAERLLAGALPLAIG
jgi:hypothetical protein